MYALLRMVLLLLGIALLGQSARAEPLYVVGSNGTGSVIINGVPIPVTPLPASGPPRAADFQPPQTQQSFIQYDSWIKTIGMVFSKSEFIQVALLIGTILAIIGVFLFGIYVVSNGNDGSQMLPFIARCLAGLALIGTSASGLSCSPGTICNVPDLFKNLWHVSYKWSANQTFAMNKQVAAEIAEKASKFPEMMANMSVAYQATTKRIYTNSVSYTASSDNATPSAPPQSLVIGLIMGFMSFVSGLIYVMLGGVYTGVVLMSIIVILSGKFLFPIFGGMLMLPGSMGITAIAGAMRTMLSAVIVAALLPLFYAVVTFMAVMIPMTELGNYADYIARWNAAMAESITDITSGFANGNIVVEAGMNMLIGGTIDRSLQTMKMIGALTVGIVSMVGALGIAGTILKSLDKIIGSFIGGITFAYDNPAGRVIQEAMNLGGRAAMGAVGGGMAMAAANSPAGMMARAEQQAKYDNVLQGVKSGEGGGGGGGFGLSGGGGGNSVGTPATSGRNEPGGLMSASTGGGMPFGGSMTQQSISAKPESASSNSKSQSAMSGGGSGGNGFSSSSSSAPSNADGGGGGAYADGTANQSRMTGGEKFINSQPSGIVGNAGSENSLGNTSKSASSGSSNAGYEPMQPPTPPGQSGGNASSQASIQAPSQAPSGQPPSSPSSGEVGSSPIANLAARVGQQVMGTSDKNDNDKK